MHHQILSTQLVPAPEAANTEIERSPSALNYQGRVRIFKPN